MSRPVSQPVHTKVKPDPVDTPTSPATPPETSPPVGGTTTPVTPPATSSPTTTPPGFSLSPSLPGQNSNTSLSLPTSLPISLNSTTSAPNSTSQIVLTSDGQTTTVVTVFVPGSSPSTIGDNAGGSKAFLQNTGAMAGVFTVVGLVGLAVLVWLVTAVFRRRRAKKFDDEIAAAAAEAANAHAPDFDDFDLIPPNRQGGGSSGYHTGSRHFDDGYYPGDRQSGYTGYPAMSEVSTSATYLNHPVEYTNTGDYLGLGGYTTNGQSGYASDPYAHSGPFADSPARHASPAPQQEPWNERGSQYQDSPQQSPSALVRNRSAGANTVMTQSSRSQTESRPKESYANHYKSDYMGSPDPELSSDEGGLTNPFARSVEDSEDNHPSPRVLKVANE